LYPGNYTFVFYDWGCDGLTGEEMTGSYTLRINGEDVHTGGTTMDKYWEEVNMEFKNEVFTTNSSSGQLRKEIGWKLVVGVMSLVAVVWG
jgi:hypothetical protein